MSMSENPMDPHGHALMGVIVICSLVLLGEIVRFFLCELRHRRIAQ